MSDNLFNLPVEVEASIITAAASLAAAMPKPDVEAEQEFRRWYEERFDHFYIRLKGLIETYSKATPGDLSDLRGNALDKGPFSVSDRLDNLATYWDKDKGDEVS